VKNKIEENRHKRHKQDKGEHKTDHPGEVEPQNNGTYHCGDDKEYRDCF